MGNETDKKRIVLHLRNSEDGTKPPVSAMTSGEIAMTTFSDHEKMYIKNKDGQIVDFSSDHIVYDKMGLSATTTPIGTEYVYNPQGELISACTSFNHAIETLAGKEVKGVFLGEEDTE